MNTRMKYLLSLFGYYMFAILVSEYISEIIGNILIALPLVITGIMILLGIYYTIRDFFK